MGSARAPGLAVPPWAGWGSLALVLALWVALVAVPLFAVLSRVKGPEALFDPGVLGIARLTALQAVASAGISALVGLPLGLWMGSFGGRLAAACESLLAMPFGVPSIVAAMAWVVLLGKSGPLAFLDLSYSLGAVILAHVFFNVPWVALLVAQSRRGLAPRLEEAASGLGAGAWARFRFVAWPQVRWAFWSASAQALAFCVMSFALVLVLGGGPPVQTLETALYGRVRFGALDLSGAVACAAWELVLTLIPWCAVLWFQSRERRAIGNADAGWSRRSSRFGSISAVALGSFFILPYLGVYAGSFGGLSPGDFFGEIRAPLLVSVELACLSGLGALLLAVLTLFAMGFVRSRASVGNALAALLLLPGGMSALVLGLGLWLAYGRWIDPFAGSLAAMAALQVALFFPIAFRALWPLAQAMPLRRLEAALTLGASPWRAFWLLDWPRWRGPVSSALGLVIAASISEVAAVSLFYSEELVPLPLLVSRWMAQYRFEEAQAVAALLLTLAMGSVLILRGVGGRRVR
ncbi:MAG: ABC transporter permease subunit [Oligoflexia bacterium]|nr:ABC transporter permease subunit [Oligoflexia bacterium]